jgi:hypothetical protein
MFYPIGEAEGKRRDIEAPEEGLKNRSKTHYWGIDCADILNTIAEREKSPFGILSLKVPDYLQERSVMRKDD